MDGFMVLAFVIIGLALFGMTAIATGVDSRQLYEESNGEFRPTW